MYKVFDVECPNCLDVKEDVLIANDSLVICGRCQIAMNRLPPIVPGYVRGTDNPCKC